MRGRPRKPTKLKILEGNRAKVSKAKLNRPKPEPRPGIPDPPDWFDADALAEWNRIVPELDRLGLLTVVDGSALEGACTAKSLAVKCWKLLQGGEITQTVTTKFGEVQKERAEFGMFIKAWSQYKGFCTEYGLTAASREKLSASTDRKRESDPIADAIFGT